MCTSMTEIFIKKNSFFSVYYFIKFKIFELASTEISKYFKKPSVKF